MGRCHGGCAWRILASSCGARTWQTCYCHKLLGVSCRKAPVRLLRRGSVFSQRSRNSACVMTLQEASELGVFSFWYPGKLPIVGVWYSTCQFLTMSPVLLHYSRTIPPLFGGRGRNQTEKGRFRSENSVISLGIQHFCVRLSCNIQN
jgi:hypothetical protein